MYCPILNRKNAELQLITKNKVDNDGWTTVPGNQKKTLPQPKNNIHIFNKFSDLAIHSEIENKNNILTNTQHDYILPPLLWGKKTNTIWADES